MRRYTSSNAENVNLVEAELHRRWGHEVIVGRRVMLTKGEGFGGVGGSFIFSDFRFTSMRVSTWRGELVHLQF